MPSQQPADAARLLDQRAVVPLSCRRVPPDRVRAFPRKARISSP
jgi:hypothetical protein